MADDQTPRGLEKAEALVVVSDDLKPWSEDKRRRYARFLVASLSGIPWVGGVLSASAALASEVDQSKVNELLRSWLEEHRRKLERLGRDIGEIVDRVEELGEEASTRLENPQFLALVEQAFRAWDRASSDEKRTLLKKLLSNAAGTELCDDDLVRLFIAWIDYYHESHFAVIREIYQNPGTNRAQIWQQIHGSEVREDSAEADLFKLLIRDLSMGGVIRQRRETTTGGEFIRRKPGSGRPPASRVMKSAFDSGDPYVLTELGGRFVHYVLTDVVRRIGDETGDREGPRDL
jgi:hypothetical protein